MSLWQFFSGCCTVQAGASCRTALLDICLQNGINYTSFCCLADGGISFCTTFASAHRLKTLCKACGVPITVCRRRGLPWFLYRHRRRAGLALGCLAAIALMLLSGRFVWDVRVTGNVEMTREEVLAELRGCGLHIGAYIPNIQTGALENRILIASDRISWVSVYLDGTVARVQVIEHSNAPAHEDTTRPANLIAAADGQIEVVQLYRGNCVVVRGQAVKKGDLLISGIYDSNVYGYRWTRAAGKVMARTEHDFRVEIPLAYEKKEASDPLCAEIKLNFFDFSLKIFKNSGNLPPMCDIIEEEKRAWCPGEYALPLGLAVTTAIPYTTQPATRTPDEALQLAYAELDLLLGGLSDTSEFLRKDITTTLTDGSLILECTVSCIEDIAVQSEFDITE